MGYKSKEWIFQKVGFMEDEAQPLHKACSYQVQL